jgi:hypothetical protein
VEAGAVVAVSLPGDRPHTEAEQERRSFTRPAVLPLWPSPRSRWRQVEVEAGAVVAVSLPGDARQGPQRPDPAPAGEAPAGRRKLRSASPSSPPATSSSPSSIRRGAPSIRCQRARSGKVGFPPRQSSLDLASAGLAGTGSGRCRYSDRGAGGEVRAVGSRPPLLLLSGTAVPPGGRGSELPCGDGDEGDF